MNSIKNIITGKQISKQLKADLIGKDSYRGVTLTYSWLANQFGHFSLGFLPSIILQRLLQKHTHIATPAFVAAIVVAVSWLLFELYNFLGPLLLKKHSTSHKLYVPTDVKYTFQPAWANVAFDTFTDVCFFAVGAFAASLFGGIIAKEIYVICTLIVILMYPVRYWFITKMLLQYARFPVQFRLSQWKGIMSQQNKETVENYIKKSNNTNGNHLLIFGGRKTGKSLLSIGVATDFAIKQHNCSYYTATKWYNLLELTNEEIIMAEDCDVWSWRTANVLVIDDVNPSDPLHKDFITPTDLKSFIENTTLAQENKADLKNKNVIWVMGKVDATNNAEGWVQMLKQTIGVVNIEVIKL